MSKHTQPYELMVTRAEAERRILKAVKAEREACAKIADSWGQSRPDYSWSRITCEQISSKIRRRK